MLQTHPRRAPAALFRKDFHSLIRKACGSLRASHAGRLELFALALFAASGLPPGAARAAPPSPKLIILSWDGAADWVVDQLLAEGRLPHLARLRARGAAAEHAIPSFPSKTAVSHAALWTGCWPGCNGVTANDVLLEPPSRHTLLETRRGFSSEVLTAEPLFVTAAKAGKKVVVLSATHSYPPLPWLRTLQAEGVPASNLLTFSGFEHRIAGGVLLDASALRPAAGWPRPPPHSGAMVELRATVGDTPFDVLIFDDPEDPVDGLDTLWIRRGGKTARGAPSARLKPRPANLEAEGWSPAFAVRRGGLAGKTFFRLFELAPDGSRLALYRRAAHALRGAHDRRQLAAYLEAYPGFHDDAFWHYRRGGLGPSRIAGGDGTAESRLLEIVAHDVELLKRGTRFALERWRPDLLFHYSPMSDSAGHQWMGILDPASPAHEPALAAELWPVYTRVYELLDDWLGDVVRHASPETVVALVTDHGMAGTSHDLHVNHVLERAGLVRRGKDGGIDLAGTRILASDSGLFLRVNDRRFRGGVVAPAERAAVIDAAAAALLAARDPATGQPVVERVWRAGDFPELGLEGPRQADLYLDPAPGYYPEPGAADRLLTSQGRGGEGNHGFWPHRRRMQGLFYAAGPGIRAGAIVPPIRQIDVAPTLARLLGIPAPARASGRVIVELLTDPDG